MSAILSDVHRGIKLMHGLSILVLNILNVMRFSAKSFMMEYFGIISLAKSIRSF